METEEINLNKNKNDALGNIYNKQDKKTKD